LVYYRKEHKTNDSLRETGQWVVNKEPIRRYRLVEELSIFKAQKAEQAKVKEKAEEIDDPKGKEMFNSIAQEEENHLTILKGEYDYVSNSGFWCGIQEFILER